MCNTMPKDVPIPYLLNLNMFVTVQEKIQSNSSNNRFLCALFTNEL